MFTLHHSFEQNYGGSSSKTATKNLMDYAVGTELAAWQWAVMANPAVITAFDGAEDGLAVGNDEPPFYPWQKTYNYNPYDYLLMFENIGFNKINDLLINTTKKIAIDPGHGDKHNSNKQIDPGAVSGDDHEKDLALKIGREVKNRLLDRGINTLMTREDDTLIDGQRIKWRLEKANNDICDIFVSIHLNASTNTNARGFVVLYLENSDNSKNLSQNIVKKQTIMKIRGNNGLEPRPKEGATRVGVLSDFKGESSILVEVGFISNKEDLEIIKNKYKEIGIEIADGICEYLKN